MLKCDKEGGGVGGLVKTPLFLLKMETQSETEPFHARIMGKGGGSKKNSMGIESGLI